MSNSLAIDDSTRFAAGQQKMSFSQTCNLLSQYVKEKRALGISSNLDSARGGATMNLFPVKQQAAEDSNGSVGRTINLFPQISGFNSSGNKRASPEPTAAQMTIFYGGQVVVFNDLPAEKAKEVLDLATSIESSLKKRKVETPSSPVPVSVPASPVPVPVPVPSPVGNIKPVTTNPNPNVSAPNHASPAIPAATAVARATVPSVSDLPIARKASLHRFLEKRKDRLVGKAPGSPNVGASKAVESKAWLGLNSLPIFQGQQKQEQED